MPKSTMALLNLLFWSLTLFATALGSSPAALQASEDHPSGSLEQIMPGHYAYYSRNRVSGVIVTSEGVVVIDALSSEAMAQHEREVISSVIKQPVRFLVSSSFHNNYTRGNVAYQDAIRIGHENYRADLLELLKEVSVAEREARLPHQTYRDRMTLHLGGKKIQILHFGRAHTRGDSIVFVPEDRIVYLSELFFYDRFPWMNTGYGIDWLQALDIALALEADIFVPAHGRMSDDPRESRQALLRFRQVLVDVRDAVQKQIARGATEDQAVAAVTLPQYQDLPGYKQQREIVVRRTYKELTVGLP